MSQRKMTGADEEAIAAIAAKCLIRPTLKQNDLLAGLPSRIDLSK